MRVQVDRWKGLNSQNIFPFGDQNWKKSLEPYFVSRTSRTEFIGPFSVGVQNGSPNHSKLFKTKQVPNNFEQSKEM